jgi:hypothetical protein
MDNRPVAQDPPRAEWLVFAGVLVTVLTALWLTCGP